MHASTQDIFWQLIQICWAYRIMLFFNTLRIPVYLPKAFPWSSKEDYLLLHPLSFPEEAETDCITILTLQALTLSYSHFIPSLVSQKLFPKISKHRVYKSSSFKGIEESLHSHYLL